MVNRPKASRGAAVGVALVALALVLAVLLVLRPWATPGEESAGAPKPSGSDSTGPRPAQSKGASPSPESKRLDVSGTGVATPEDSREAVSGFVLAASAALARPTGATDRQLADMATGSALKAVETQRAEFLANKWHQTGAPKVVSVKVLSADGARVRVQACLDNKPVTVRDRSGRTVPNSGFGGRVSHVYVMQRGGSDGWRVVEDRFASPPTC